MRQKDLDPKPINEPYNASIQLHDANHTKGHLTTYTRILRLNEVIQLTGLSRSTIYHYISKNLFPPQIKLGLRAVGWRYHDIQHWIEQK